MLAARREFTVLDERFKTPLIVPSYSSRAVDDEVREVIDVTRSFVTGPILVSAFDVLKYGVRQVKLSNARLVFLDSGGYEAGKEGDFSETEDPRKLRGDHRRKDLSWSRNQYQDVISNWDFSSSTVLVSYDDPYRRETLERQISRARKDFQALPKACTTILLKPEPLGRKQRKKERVYLNIDKIIECLPQLRHFHMIGLTEKELGNSFLDRMIKIARLRLSMTKEGMSNPIHIFGSLDPVTTPLYFLSGADIFDGLTWLRYAYNDGLAIYRPNFLARGKEVPLGIEDGQLSAQVQLHNYFSLGRLQEAMMRFASSKDYGAFSENGDFFRNSAEQLIAEVGGLT